MNVVLGISGGIAAYKTPELVRRLRERGADVQIVMTASAEEFVTETALQAVSGKPIRSNLWDKEAEASMSHIELARWADVVLIAPATAEVIARLASGGAPDLLSTLCLATEAPVAIAPAMNHVMWSNPAVQANRDTLVQRGVHIIGPASGSQACGETGAGRMTEPGDIAAAVFELADEPRQGVLSERTVLITAGPTREPIDPVRYISNRSSGKMGYALASAAAAAGAEVVLVSGPVAIDPPHGVRVVRVETAEEMYQAVHEEVAAADIFVSVAAVSDYGPVTTESRKIKKQTAALTLELEPTKDILASVAALDTPPFTVGFAAETNDVEAYARKKLAAKNLDMIIANRVGTNLGFETDENAVEVIWSKGSVSLARAAKPDVAAALVLHVADRYRTIRGAS